MEELAIVTGGSSGLGFCLSRELLQRGRRLCILGRDEAKLQRAQKELAPTAAEAVEYFAGDISDEGFVKQVFEQIRRSGRTLKYLFNCAGAGQFGPVEKNTRSQIDIAFSASLIGLILISSNAFPLMRESGGVIVNVMSTAALRGKANESVYCAAKWGARGFTEALKAAAKGTKVRVLSVYPGGMDTPFWKPDGDGAPDTSGFMRPEDVAEEILHAAAERANLCVSELVIERR